MPATARDIARLARDPRTTLADAEKAIQLFADLTATDAAHIASIKAIEETGARAMRIIDTALNAPLVGRKEPA